MFDYRAGANLSKKARPKDSEFRLIVSVAGIVGQRKRTALGTFFATMVLVLLAYFIVTPRFEASILLVVGQTALDRSPDSRRDASENATSMISIVESEGVIRQAIEKVGLDRLIEPSQRDLGKPGTAVRKLLSFFSRAPQREITELDRAIPALSAALKVTHPPGSQIIRISFRHINPVTAAEFVDAVAQSFIDRQLILFGRAGAADFFQNQKAQFDEEIRQYASDLQAFVTANKVYSIDDERQLLLKRASDTSAALAATRGLVADKMGQKETITAQLRLLKPVTLSPFVASVVTALGSDDHSEKNRSVATHEITAPPEDHRLSETPPLLMVRVYQEAMVALFKVNGELTGFANLEQEQTDELRRLDVALSDLSSREAEFGKLKRNLAQALLNSDVYARKMVEERISAESSAAKFSTIKVVQKAYVPLKPVSPSFATFAGVSLVVAVMAAITVALGLQTLARNELIANAASGSPLAPLGDHEMVPRRRRQLKKRPLDESREANDVLQLSRVGRNFSTDGMPEEQIKAAGHSVC